MEYLLQFVDMVLHLDKHLDLLLGSYGVWVYGILFLIIFCETGFVVTPFLPGDSLLFVAGALAARGGLDITILVFLLFVAAVAGDNLNYWIGRGIGPRVFRWEKSRFFNRAAFDKTHAYFERHGGKTIILARFIPLIRTFAPFVAGVGRMTYRRYLPLDVLGGALWIGSLTVGGYLFGNLPWVKSNLSVVVLGIVAVSLMPVAITYLRGRLAQARAS